MSTLPSYMPFDLGGDGAPEAHGRMMLSLLPPGRLWNLVGSVLVSTFEAFGIELGRVAARGADLVQESDPNFTTELLPEHERELGLEQASTTEERRARVIARTVARQRFRPVDFQTALASLLGQDAEDVVVIERTHAFAVSIGDEREIYRFFIYRDPDEPGTYFLDSAQEIVDLIKPSHTAGQVIESINFLCDDEFSLCDRDLLGA